MEPPVEVSVLSTAVLRPSVVVVVCIVLVEDDESVGLEEVEVASPSVIFFVCFSVVDIVSVAEVCTEASVVDDAGYCVEDSMVIDAVDE